MNPCIQEDRIKRIEEMLEKLSDSQPNSALVDERIHRILDMVEEHERALKGNNGTVGIIAKVAGALDVLNELSLTLKGHADKVGLVGAVERLAEIIIEWKDERKWFIRLVGAWLVTTILGAIILLIR